MLHQHTYAPVHGNAAPGTATLHQHSSNTRQHCTITSPVHNSTAPALLQYMATLHHYSSSTRQRCTSTAPIHGNIPSALHNQNLPSRLVWQHRTRNCRELPAIDKERSTATDHILKGLAWGVHPGCVKNGKNKKGKQRRQLRVQAAQTNTLKASMHLTCLLHLLQAGQQASFRLGGVDADSSDLQVVDLEAISVLPA
eukprot:1148151-Pelagomonas_calceolata.AAC.4